LEENEQFQDIYKYFKGEISSVSPMRFEEFRKCLYLMTKRLRRNFQEADIHDIVQETTIKLLVMVKDDKIHSNFLGAAYWAIRDVLKRYQHKAEIVEMNERIPSDSNVEKNVETKEMIGKLNVEVGKLPKNEQTILFKRYVSGMKLVEIAEEIGIKPETLRVQHKRMIAKLRDKLPDILIEI
jgi:RNA polymerase sigma factor (sigma-70 family)